MTKYKPIKQQIEESKEDPFAIFNTTSKPSSSYKEPLEEEEFTCTEYEKMLAASLIKIINFREKCPDYDNSFFLKQLECLEKGYLPTRWQLFRIFKAYHLTVCNEKINDSIDLNELEKMAETHERNP